MGYEQVSPLSAKGIGRDPENEQTLFVSFNRCPTDDEMRVIHNLLRRLERSHRKEVVPADPKSTSSVIESSPRSEVRASGGEEPTEEMVEAACAAFDKAATAEGWKCDNKQKAAFIRWMRCALSAALRARKEQTHD